MTSAPFVIMFHRTVWQVREWRDGRRFVVAMAPLFDVALGVAESRAKVLGVPLLILPKGGTA